MKRLASKMLTLAALATVVFAGLLASGCAQLGIGSTGAGIPQLGQAVVNTPAISEAGTLRVGVDAANAPFSTLIDEKMVGINVDLAAALANEMGLKVKIVDVGSNPESALEAGSVDIVMGMDSADTTATCWLSDPYLSTAVAIFATSSGAILPTAASHDIIEAQESSMSAWEISNQFGEESLKTAADLRTVFEDLEGGQTTYAAADAIIGSYVSRSTGGKAQIVGLMQKAGGYCIGVSAANNDLKPAIEAAVKALNEKGIADVIEAKWLGHAINFDGIALTEAAAKADANAKPEADEADKDAEAKKKDAELGNVGGNAVALEDDGSQPGQEGDTTGATDGYWGYGYDTTPAYTEEPVYEDTTDYGNGGDATDTEGAGAGGDTGEGGEATGEGGSGGEATGEGGDGSAAA